MRGQLSKETRLEISITRLKKSVEELLLTIKDHAHVITRHWCSACVCFVKSKDIPPISRIGVNVLGYMLMQGKRES